MKKNFLFVFLLSAAFQANAQYDSTFYPDHAAAYLRQQREKDLYYDNTGNSYRQINNVTYSQQGVNYTRSGNQISGSDGSLYEVSGDFIYKNGRAVCHRANGDWECSGAAPDRW